MDKIFYFVLISCLWASAAVSDCSLEFASLLDGRSHDSKALERYGPSRELVRLLKFVSNVVRPDLPSIYVGKRSIGFAEQAARSIASGTKRMGLALVPVPLPAGRRTAVEKIFFHQWREPSYVPSDAEKALLIQTKSLSLFQERARFLKAHPWVPPVKQGGRFAAGGLLLLEAGVAANQATEISENTSNVDAFLGLPSEDERGLPIVQVIVESPIPHTALRIGSRVYSYGVDRMEASDVQIYFGKAAASMNGLSSSKSSAPGAKTDGELANGQANPAKSDAVKVGSTKGDDKPISKSTSVLPGLGERSVRVNNLRLSAENISSLRRELEMNTGKTYINRTLINDCSTMIARALERNTPLSIPVVIDSLPSVTSTYLSLRRALGDALVGPTQMVVFDEKASRRYHLARNALVSMQELKVALLGAAWNAPARVYIDMTKSSGDLQFHGEDELKQIESLRRQAVDLVDSSLNEIIGDPSLLSPDQKGVARRFVERKLAEEKAESIESLNTPQATFKEMIVANAKIDSIDNLMARWHERLKP